MDILISSNLERLLYEISDHDEVLIKDLMHKLSTEGMYEIPDMMKQQLKDFYGDYSTEAEVFDAIKQLYEDESYLIDTHTAVAYSVYQKYVNKTGDITPTIIASTASPFKFGEAVSKAIGIDILGLDDFSVLEKLAEAAKVKVPAAVKELKLKPILHSSLAKKNEIKTVIENFLGGIK
ncbi:MAG: thrC, partial [Clostridia bacterium]|nr:thrC [Clostridia bacterium]